MAGYNASTGQNSTGTYNPNTPAVAGNPSSALGVTAPGSPTGGTAATPISATLVSYYAYPDNATYPVTVAPGGNISIVVS